jgi:hypothetical protein
LRESVKAHSNIVPLTIKRYGDEMGLASAPLEFPREMVPCTGIRRRASNACRYPMSGWAIPNPPGSGSSEVALGAKDISISAHVLIYVELQGLRVRD